MNKLIKPIYIKPEPYFYKYYNNYIKQSQNCESDKFIQNLLKCKFKIINPCHITKDDFLKNFNNYENDIKNAYYLKIKENINNCSNTCSICYEELNDNYIITPCLHSYCLKCCNYIYFNNNNKKKNINDTCFKCSICNSIYDENKLYLLTDKKKNIIQILIELYEVKKNVLNKEFIYHNIGYKSYYIMSLIYKNNYTFYINPKNKIQTKKVIIEKNNEWNNYMSVLFPHIFFFENIEMFYSYYLSNYSMNKFEIYFTNNKISENTINLIKILKKENVKFYQFIIKNTIDEKIFKGKVIIKN